MNSFLRSAPGSPADMVAAAPDAANSDSGTRDALFRLRRLLTAVAQLVRNRWLLLVVVVLMAAWGARYPLREGLTPPDAGRNWRADCDRVMLKKGLDAAPRFSDTFKWWTGNWIGCNPFWRPMSSYAFWAMYKAFGWQHQDTFALITAFCHIAAMVLLFLLAAAVVGSDGIAALAVALLNVGIPVRYLEKYVASPGIGGIFSWIYIPDIWMTICLLSSLLLAWRRRLWWAMALAAMAAMFKESGFMAFPLVAGFYWVKWRRPHKAFWGLAALAALLAAVKLIFVGPGWILGSNKALWYRIFVFVAGWPLQALFSYHAPWIIVGCGLAVAIILRNNRWSRYGAVPAAVLLASVVHWILSGTGTPQVSFIVAMAAVLDWKLLAISSMRATVWIVAAYAGLRGRFRHLILLFVAANLIAGFPATIAPQTGQRSFYAAFALCSVAKALCAASIPALFIGQQRWKQFLRRLRSGPERKTQTAGRRKHATAETTE